MCCGDQLTFSPSPHFQVLTGLCNNMGIWNSWNPISFITPSDSDQQGLSHTQP